MKKLIFTMFLVLMISCISSKKDGFIKTKDNDVTHFRNARLVYLPTAIWVIKKQSEVSIDKKNIKEIVFEK